MILLMENSTKLGVTSLNTRVLEPLPPLPSSKEQEKSNRFRGALDIYWVPVENVNFRLGDGVGAKRERGLNVASLKTVQWSMGICPTSGSHLPHGERLPNVLLPQVPFSIPNCSDCECVQAGACLLLLIYQLTPERPNTHPLLPQGLIS